jgi:hypothetical protein
MSTSGMSDDVAVVGGGHAKRHRASVVPAAPGIVTSRVDEYRRHARECLELSTCRHALRNVSGSFRWGSECCPNFGGFV